jgi:Fe-S cluster biogenesis protein NfuA
MNDLSEITVTYEVDRRRPAICRFTVNRTLHIGTARFNSRAEAHGSLLVQKLFDIGDVAEVQLIGHLLVLAKTGERNWEEIVKSVEAILHAYLISGSALSREQVEDRMMLMGRGVREKIKYLIDHKINPGVGVHGGFIELIEVKDNNVYIRLSGGCQGCAAADFTLRQGIEEVIRREVPEINQVLDITNHAAGTKPYYRPAK